MRGTSHSFFSSDVIDVFVSGSSITSESRRQQHSQCHQQPMLVGQVRKMAGTNLRSRPDSSLTSKQIGFVLKNRRGRVIKEGFTETENVGHLLAVCLSNRIHQRRRRISNGAQIASRIQQNIGKGHH